MKKLQASRKSSNLHEKSATSQLNHHAPSKLDTPSTFDVDPDIFQAVDPDWNNENPENIGLGYPYTPINVLRIPDITSIDDLTYIRLSPRNITFFPHLYHLSHESNYYPHYDPRYKLFQDFPYAHDDSLLLVQRRLDNFTLHRHAFIPFYRTTDFMPNNRSSQLAFSLRGAAFDFPYDFSDDFIEDSLHDILAGYLPDPTMFYTLLSHMQRNDQLRSPKPPNRQKRGGRNSKNSRKRRKTLSVSFATSVLPASSPRSIYTSSAPMDISVHMDTSA